MIPIVGAGSATEVPTFAFDKETVETFSKQIVNISSPMKYGVGKKAEFTIKNLNIITIEK